MFGILLVVSLKMVASRTRTLIQEFGQLCDKIGVKTGWSNPWTNPLDGAVMRDLMQKSFLNPDLRNDTHKRWGTKTCRVFKTMSYGSLGLTNSPKTGRVCWS